MNIVKTPKSTGNNILNALLAIAVTCLLIVSPMSNAASKAKEPASKSQSEMVVAKVNINQSDAETIAQVLEGVGLKKAEAIVAYRKAHGSFKSIEQLTAVKGIGEKTVAKNKGKIVL